MRMGQTRTPRLNQFPRLLLSEWRKLRLPFADETVIVAVSGGADSTALLLALAELKNANKLFIKICVAHLDHRLRKTSAKDAAWVKELSAKLGYECVVGRSKVEEIARSNADNLEQAAREARYAFLERTAKRKSATFILTGHTMDDQAETVLLRLMRGSASPGLGGMEQIRPLGKKSAIKLVRPLLWARRADTETYCRLRKTEFLTDEMNDDQKFARVKVRQQLLPLMQSFNNKIVEAISRTASQLREDAAVLLNDSDALLRRAAVLDHGEDETQTAALDVKVLAAAAPALRRRALRQWISEARGSTRRLEMVHLLAVEKLLEGSAGGRVVELPGGSRVRKKKNRLEFEQQND
ncbi:MAG TPA: tRNA lysidine(34) synthetase TilS [Pyrinomonadaceae bacterium]|nr:tRNA lysidine(34) synthetase TilS [Pyrinomonadaceae bacterium]